MKMDCTADPAPDIATASPQVLRQLGAITRQLNDTLAADLEDSLVKLLVRAAPQEIAKDQARALPGRVIEPTGRDDTVANQREVDEPLASLGF